MAYNVSIEELKSFYGIDRQLFVRLTTELGRDRNQAMQVMAFWLLLEEIGYPSIILALRDLPAATVNAVYDEAVTCLAAVESENPPVATSDDIPITYLCLLNEEVSLLFLHETRGFVLDGIAKTTQVYTWIFEDDGLDLAQDDDSDQENMDQSSDPLTRRFRDFHLGGCQGEMVDQEKGTIPSIMPKIPYICYGLHPVFRPLLGIGVPMQGQPIDPLFYSGFGSQGPAMNFETGESSTQAHQGRPNKIHPPVGRSMFLTFSRGYPVSEEELRTYLFRRYGDVVEAIQMANAPPRGQALWAIVVFRSPANVDAILNREDRVRFVVNRKHVWARLYVPRAQE